MATKIKVEAKGRDHHIVHCEINAGAEGSLGTGSHEFSIGEHDSVIYYLTMNRLASGTIKVLAETGDVYVEVDGGHAKHVRKGSSVSIPSKAKRAIVRERPHR